MNPKKFISKTVDLIKNNYLNSNLLVKYSEIGPLLLLIILSIIFYISNPTFISSLNIGNILSFTPELGIIAIGLTMLMTSGEIDLSVGAVFGGIPIIILLLVKNSSIPFWGAFLIGLIVAALIGLINGLIVTKFKVSSIIITIGMMQLFKGISLYITEGFPQPTYEVESLIKNVLVGTIQGSGELRIFASLFWFFGLAIIFNFILHNTRFGNWILATGGNIKAARGRGINTDRCKIILFINSSIVAGFAGLISSLRILSAYPTAGEGYELEAIAMVIIGGTLLTGGKGTIIGTVIGVFLLRVIRNGIILAGVPGMAYNIFIGGIIIVMMIFHSLANKSRMRES